jgi:hypothetical protein
MEFFDDIEAHHCSAFTVMVQQAGSLWTNQELNGEIRQQNSRLGNLTDSYSRFVPFQFLELLNRDSIEEIDAGDHVSIETSVLFADIRDFTALSEALGPAGTFAALNEFLVAVEPKVEQAGGFINQYLGDAVMALIPGRADAALSCAIQMIGQSRELNARRSGSGELAIRFGMGISSGPLMLGAIGGGKRLDSNVVGDMPNSEHHGVNFIVAQCSRLFRRLKLGSKREIRHFPAHFSITTSIVPRWPEPGLPILTRLPFRSANFAMPLSARATTVNGSGCTEKTARSSLNAPSGNCFGAVP